MAIPTITLNDGYTIPQVGLGLWQITGEREFNTAFDAAIAAGYRHFDGAQAYGNEQLLGDAWKRSGIARSELFLTTKIHVINFGSALARRSFAVSLRKLLVNYVDLLLLHFPVTGMRKGTWLALEKLQADGVVRSIGVSNYTIKHLEEMKTYANVVPAVNQIELHVFLQQPELVEYCQQHGIVIEAYSPLAHAREMDEPVLIELAKKYGKTYAQIMLRWCVQKGWVVLPKSSNPERIRENIELFDFELSPEDMLRLEALDRDLRTSWSPVHVP